MDARFGIRGHALSKLRHALRELGRCRVELLLLDQLARPVGASSSCTQLTSEIERERVDRRQAGAEGRGGELLAELLDAAQLGVDGHEREVRP